MPSPQTGGCTPSDFPLARLDQATLDRLTAQTRDIQDIYPLSPMQTCFSRWDAGRLSQYSTSGSALCAAN